MSLRALKELRQEFPQDKDEDTGRPDDVIGEPEDNKETPSKCTVYFNPEHSIAGELQQLETRLRAEMAPYDGSFNFEGLTAEDLRHSSPFSTRVAENLFLKRGFARGPGLWPAPNETPRRRAGGTAHHRSREECQEALHVLALMTDKVLRSVKKFVPRSKRPIWLRPKVNTVLAPVCGRASRTRAEAAELGLAPDIPLVREGRLLLGCTNFDERRTVLPSYISTPNTAARKGRAALKRWSEAERCELYADSLADQIKCELSDPRKHFGADFDLAGAALWMCQCVMQMRLSVDDVRRRTAASWFAHENKREAHDIEDGRMRERLFKGYEEHGENSQLAFEPPTLSHKVMNVFFGVTFDTWRYLDPNNPDDRGLLSILSFVHWVRQLKLTGNASLDRWLARDICDFIERESYDFSVLLSQDGGRELDNLLGDMLPQAGWQAIYDASRSILDGDPEAVFTVSYSWQGLSESGPCGRVHEKECRVDIIGPLLMLPLHAADNWRDKAREIPTTGLYAFVGRRR